MTIFGPGWGEWLSEHGRRCRTCRRVFEAWPGPGRAVYCSDVCRPAYLLRSRARMRAFRIRVYGL